MARFQMGTRQNSAPQSIKQEPIDYQAVERVAYGLFEKRGREDGHDMEDWLKAEAIVRQRTSRSLS